MQSALPVLPKVEIAKFCQHNQIQKLSLFGSVLRSDFRSDSDIDVLVEFEPDARITYLDMARMERELSKLFLERKIDLRTPAELSQHFRDRVLSEAIVQYVKAR